MMLVVGAEYFDRVAVRESEDGEAVLLHMRRELEDVLEERDHRVVLRRPRANPAETGDLHGPILRLDASSVHNSGPPFLDTSRTPAALSFGL